MNFIRTIVAGGLIVVGASAAYGQGDNGKSGNAQDDLIDTLNAMANGLGNNNNSPPGQDGRPDDPDMGDDNAAREAILTVCTKDTPAAERSAICDGEPISPQ